MLSDSLVSGVPDLLTDHDDDPVDVGETDSLAHGDGESVRLASMLHEVDLDLERLHDIDRDAVHDAEALPDTETVPV